MVLCMACFSAMIVQISHGVGDAVRRREGRALASGSKGQGSQYRPLKTRRGSCWSVWQCRGRVVGGIVASHPKLCSGRRTAVHSEMQVGIHNHEAFSFLTRLGGDRASRQPHRLVPSTTCTDGVKDAAAVVGVKPPIDGETVRRRQGEGSDLVAHGALTPRMVPHQSTPPLR